MVSVGADRVDADLQIKLIDFNVSHSFALDAEMKGKTGIQEWSAPETRKFAAYDEKCDLWAVGCILYYLCTGQPPANHVGIRGE